MESTTVLMIGIAVVVMALTGYSIYIAFGPPSVELDDPFEDHED
jgi:PsbN protein